VKENEANYVRKTREKDNKVVVQSNTKRHVTVKETTYGAFVDRRVRRMMSQNYSRTRGRIQESEMG